MQNTQPICGVPLDASSQAESTVAAAAVVEAPVSMEQLQAIMHRFQAQVMDELRLHGAAAAVPAMEQLQALCLGLMQPVLARLFVEIHRLYAANPAQQAQFGISSSTDSGLSQQPTSLVSDLPVTSPGLTDIVLWQSVSKERPLLTFLCAPKGKRKSSILLFIESVYGALNENYRLIDITGSKIELASESFLRPGHYAIEPVGNAPQLTALHERYEINPNKSTAAAKKRKHESDGAGSSTSSNTFRNNKFRTALLQRDNHCVVSRAYDALEACHILAFKWWDESHRDELPNDIKSTVLGWTNQINDIRAATESYFRKVWRRILTRECYRFIMWMGSTGLLRLNPLWKNWTGNYWT